VSKIFLVTPVGRFVQGDLFEGSDKDQHGRPRVDKQGRPKMQWFVGLAVPKGPEFDGMWAQIVTKVQQDFPGGEWNLPTFAWKVEDGDDPKHAQREGFPGHWVMRLTSGFPPKVFDAQAVPQPVGPQYVKKGDYLQVQVGVEGNREPAHGKPGVYLNVGQVIVCGFGPEIVSGPRPEETFAQRGALPPGASATPIAPAGAMPGAPAGAPGVPGMPVPGGPAPGVPGSVAPGMPGAPAAPAPGAHPGAAPPAPGAPAPGYPGQPAPGYAAPAAPGVPGAAPGYQAPAAPPIGAPGAVPGAMPPAAAPAGAVPPMPGVPAPQPGAIAPAPGFLQPGAQPGQYAPGPVGQAPAAYPPQPGQPGYTPPQ
jgi:hypothetical protein